MSDTHTEVSYEVWASTYMSDGGNAGEIMADCSTLKAAKKRMEELKLLHLEDQQYFDFSINRVTTTTEFAYA